jgi:hypothetical protein
LREQRDKSCGATHDVLLSRQGLCTEGTGNQGEGIYGSMISVPQTNNGKSLLLIVSFSRDVRFATHTWLASQKPSASSPNISTRREAALDLGAPEEVFKKVFTTYFVLTLNAFVALRHTSPQRPTPVSALLYFSGVRGARPVIDGRMQFG